MGPNIINFELSRSSSEIVELATKLVNRLGESANEVAKSQASIDSLMKWADTEAYVSSQQAQVTFPSMVSTNSLARKESAKAKETLQNAFNANYARRDVYDRFLSLKRESVPKDSQRLLRRTMILFEKNGVNLEDEKRFIAEELKREITRIELACQQNVNEDVSTVIINTIGELDGCDEGFVHSLPIQDDGKIIISMKTPTVFSILQSCTNRNTRFKVLKAYNSRAAAENTPLLNQLILLRHRLATLLGYKSHFEYKLVGTMAAGTKEVLGLLDRIKNLLRERLLQDLAELKRIFNETTDTTKDDLQLWDVAYCESKLRKERCGVDDELVKEYFPINHVIKSIFEIYQEVLHLRFEMLPSAGVTWHEDVMLYKVYDKQSNSTIGFFLLDIYPREGKYGHQCVVPLQPGLILNDGTEIPCVACNVGNLSKPTSGRPSLLRHNEVVTFFHEFGHVVHHLCAKSRYNLFSWSWSVNPYPAGVEIDFLETPSQMLENFVYDPTILKRLSHHYKTGESLEDDWIIGIQKSRRLTPGLRYSRQIFMSLFDLNIHDGSLFEMIDGEWSLKQGVNLREIWANMQVNSSGMEMIEETDPHCSFYHLYMGGYDAVYWCYLWAEVNSHTLFTRFDKSPKRCLDENLGLEYRQKILEPGANLDAVEMLRNFLGRNPNSNDEHAFIESLVV